MIKKWFCAVIAVIGLNPAFSQTINSPYSNNGLGELFFQGLPHNYAMGELGVGTPSLAHINLQNPAMLTSNIFSTFQVGLSSDFRSYETSEASGSDNSAGLRFLALSFPVVRNRWVTSLAALPLTNVKYNTFSTDTLVTGAVNTTSFQGDGGLSQAIWTNGFRIYKSLSLGVRASFVFGTIDKSSRIKVSSDDFESAYVVSLIESTSYNDFKFTAGLSYKVELAERTFLNLGATYDIGSSLDGEMDQLFQRQTSFGTLVQELALIENEEVEFDLPSSYAFGASFEKFNSFKIGLDLSFQNWANSQQEPTNLNFRNSTNISFGGEWIPDVQNVSSYFKRATYRFGLISKQLPYLVNETEINDFGINFGTSLPVSGYSSLDLAFKYGARGTISNGLIRENYFQIVLGATINDRWFIKRRYD